MGLGRPRAVIQLLDRHNRDSETLAERLAIPWERVPGNLRGTPFEVIDFKKNRWKEVALRGASETRWSSPRPWAPRRCSRWGGERSECTRC